MVAEFFPQAKAHLESAQHARTTVARLWAEQVSELVDATVLTDPDGTGCIVVYADWPPAFRAALTDGFSECIAELWACLDSLVVESVDMLSSLRRPRDPDAPRYFPIAPNAEDFDALLAESCIDGILQTQFQVVRDCQAFASDPANERVERYRAGLRQLVDWSHRLGEGSLLGAWATPTDPQVQVEPPAHVVRLECEPAAELADELIVARFELHGDVAERQVRAQPGTFIDLAFVDGFVPRDPTDTFERRLDTVFETVARLARAFAAAARRTPVTTRVLFGTNQTNPWTEASRSERGWTASELSALAASDLGLGIVRDDDCLVLLVTTPDGIYERRIPDATPLRQQIPHGVAAERASQEAVATWGLPDFIMRPFVERKGRGVREISDGLLVVGDRGVILQVKGRDAEPRDPDREARWIDKQIAAAIKQANGTARRLSEHPVEMMNGRGRRVSINGATISWVTAVIIEHPSPPEDHSIPTLDSRTPAVVLMRRDWEFLFSQLRSTRAVADYLHRVGVPTDLLGGEPMRYYELAAADAEAAAQPITTLRERYAGQRRSVPLLPTAPAGTEDDVAHAMVRIMCEDIATSPAGDHEEADRIWVLASIDRLPVGHRTELGRLLLDSLHEARGHQGDKTFFKFRTFRPDQPNDVQLGFGISSTLSELIREAFRSWFMLRHHERGDFDVQSSAASVGVLLTPRHDGLREWDTTMIAMAGDPQLSAEDLDQLRRVWNR